MARRLFFVPQVQRGVAELTGDEADHLVRVLRAEVDQVYEISDNENLYLARVTAAYKSMVSFEVLETLQVPKRAVRLTLGVALFKFDHFEWLLEKATELGVDEILPFEAARSERGLMQASLKRNVRWQRIVLEASQQSRRCRLPAVANASRYQDALQAAAQTKIFLDEEPGAPPIVHLLASVPATDRELALMLGPEGGWTDAERSLALAHGWRTASLGSTILRAETAGISALAVVNAWAATLTGQTIA